MINLISSKIKINKNDSLTTLVKKNAIFSLVLKVLSVFLSFWSVKVAFDFTGSQKIYGLWLTILSVISWLGLLNAGMGNGLRNKLSQALATGNNKDAKVYVSTSYVFISFITVGCIIIYFIINFLVDWRRLFGADYISKIQFTTLFSVVVISYFVQLTLSTINAICFAFNRSTLPSLFTFISNASYVISLYILSFFGNGGLVILGITYSSSIIIVLLLANIYLFSAKYSDIKPNIKYFNRKYVQELMGNGVKFFFLEIAAVIIFATDSIIITHLVGTAEVAIYQLVMKLFSVFMIASSTIMVPLWSAFTHAYSKGDIQWIRKIINKILLLVIPLVIGVTLFSFLVNPVLKIWVGNSISASKTLIFIVALYVVINIWSNIFAYFLNGVNKINGQLLTVGIGAIANIPMSILLGQHLGSVGVVLATVICLIPFSVLGPISTYKVINAANK
ncbi:MATE family efflux transporter [Peribacillus kribbensis]|uniref:MATE family efflux transporter n=1 Tax=Peribacillus kribbensis TaxID=356658 RepID=UPI00041FA4D6|nr:MATE family efflux transporter [Peribacillus kribbensis]